MVLEGGKKSKRKAGVVCRNKPKQTIKDNFKNSFVESLALYLCIRKRYIPYNWSYVVAFLLGHILSFCPNG